MNRRMDVQRRGFNRPLAGDQLARQVHLAEVTCSDLGPVHAKGREIKPIRASRHQQRHVVVDCLVKCEARGNPVTCGQINARLPLEVGLRLDGLDIAAHDCCLSRKFYRSAKFKGLGNPFSGRA